MQELFELGTLSLSVAAGIMILATAVQGAIGFGLALIAAPVLLLIDPRFVPGPLLLSALLLTVLIAIRDRAGIHVRGVGLLVVGNLPGSLLGGVVLSMTSPTALTRIIGVLVLLAVVISGSGVHVRPTRWTLLAAGGTSGFTGTVSSIGGPPIALLYQRSKGVEIRGTMSAYFTIGGTVSILAIYGAGRLGAAELSLTTWLLAPTVIGFLLSRSMATIVDRGYVRPTVLILSGVGAVAVILRTVLG